MLSDVTQEGGFGFNLTNSTEPTNGNNHVDHEAITFLHGFIAALTMTIVSEIGDKTFFIAAVMAMKHDRVVVFVGAIFALMVMTVLSVGFGSVATLIPRKVTLIVSTALFAIFGLKMLWDGCRMSSKKGKDGLQEVEATIEGKNAESSKEDYKKPTSQDIPDDDAMEEGHTDVGSLPPPTRQESMLAVCRILMKVFALTILAEWGDRSQLATIVLASRENVFAITLGGVMGHSICTAVAVLGGRLISHKISVRTVTITGGVVFLLFALSAVFFESL